MRTFSLLVLAGLSIALLAGPGPARAKGGATAVIEKAIKAYGGPEKLAQLRAVQAKAKGTMSLGGANWPCTLEITAQLPGQYRLAGVADLAGHKLTTFQVLDGDQGWAWVNGKTEAVKGRNLDEIKAQLHVRTVLQLTPLLEDKRYRLTSLPAARVNGKSTAGVAVALKGQSDVRLYFDEGTGLLAKLEREVFDETTKKSVLQEEIPGDFKAIGGLQTPMKQVWRRGGHKIMELAFSQVRYPGRIAAGEVSMPDGVTAALAGDRDLFTHVPEVVYGRKFGTALTLDVFAPRKGANGASIVFVVSGGWVSDREGLAPFYAPHVRVLVKRGYTVFAVCHGCQPRFTIPEAIADMNRAVRYIRSHAKDYAIDPDRIGISGGSAGGHLSLIQGTTGGPGDKKAKDRVERASSRVQAVACFFPPTDFLNYGTKGQNPFGPGGVLAVLRPAVDVRELDPKTKMLERLTEAKKVELLRKISPITHVTAQSAPTLIIHGDADKLVPLQQAEVLVAKLKKEGVAAKLVVKKDAAHGWAGMDTDIEVLADWFDKHLKKK